MQRNKSLILIFLILLAVIFGCFYLGEQQPNEPQFEISSNPQICGRPVTTTITGTMKGYGYLDYDQTITVPYTSEFSHSLIICNNYTLFMPLIMKNAGN